MNLIKITTFKNAVTIEIDVFFFKVEFILLEEE